MSVCCENVRDLQSLVSEEIPQGKLRCKRHRHGRSPGAVTAAFAVHAPKKHWHMQRALEVGQLVLRTPGLWRVDAKGKFLKWPEVAVSNARNLSPTPCSGTRCHSQSLYGYTKRSEPSPIPLDQQTQALSSPTCVQGRWWLLLAKGQRKMPGCKRPSHPAHTDLNSHEFAHS